MRIFAVALAAIISATPAQAEKLTASKHVEMGVIQAIYDHCSTLIEMGEKYAEWDYEISQARTKQETALYEHGYESVAASFDVVMGSLNSEAWVAAEVEKLCVAQSITFLDTGIFRLKNDKRKIP
ncbi:hypothetical protein ACQZ5N_01005 [Agrobacterium sp. 22-221-1]